METEEVVEAESTELTEEVAGAEPAVKEESSVDLGVWGDNRPEDTIDFGDDDLSTNEEEVQSEEASEEAGLGEEPAEKAPVQVRIDDLTRGRKDAEEKYEVANAELTRIKAEAAKATPAPEAKAPVWAEFEEKYIDDPDKAKVEYLAARQDYSLDQKLNAQKQAESARVVATTRTANAKNFQQEADSDAVKAKYPDFHAKVFAPTVKFNNTEIADLIQSSPQRIDLAYKIANDSTLLAKINSSSAAEAGIIIGDLQRLYGSPVNKRLKTKAPVAVPTIGTENKALIPNEEDMDIDDFLALEDKKQTRSGGW